MSDQKKHTKSDVQRAQDEIAKMSNIELSQTIMETAEAMAKGGSVLGSLILREGALRLSKLKGK